MAEEKNARLDLEAQEPIVGLDLEAQEPIVGLDLEAQEHIIGLDLEVQAPAVELNLGENVFSMAEEKKAIDFMDKEIIIVFGSIEQKVTGDTLCGRFKDNLLAIVFTQTMKENPDTDRIWFDIPVTQEIMTKTMTFLKWGIYPGTRSKSDLQTYHILFSYLALPFDSRIYEGDGLKFCGECNEYFGDEIVCPEKNCRLRVCPKHPQVHLTSELCWIKIRHG